MSIIGANRNEHSLLSEDLNHQAEDDGGNVSEQLRQLLHDFVVFAELAGDQRTDAKLRRRQEKKEERNRNSLTDRAVVKNNADQRHRQFVERTNKAKHR